MADGSVKIEVLLDDSGVGKGVKRVEGRLRGIGDTAKRGVATVGKLAASIGLVGLAYKGIDMVKKSLDGAIARYDTLNNFPRVMQVLGFDAQESDKAIRKLSDGIQGLPTRLDEVAATAQNIAMMTGDLDSAVDTTLALNNAFLASGASVQDAARGMEIYQNMLATGEVDGQRWKTLQETMGVALRMVAQQAGYEGPDALDKLYNAVKDGTITFDEFNNMLIDVNKAQGGLAELAQKNTDGLATAWMNLQAWVIMGVTNVIEAIDEAMGGVGSISGAIQRLKPIVFGIFGWIANTAVPAVADALTFVKERIEDWIPSIDGVKGHFIAVFSTMKEIVMPIVQEVVTFVMSLWSNLVTFWQQNGAQIVEAIQNAFGMVKSIIEFVMPAVLFVINMVWTAIKQVISGALDVIMGLVNVFTGIITGDFSKMWEGIKQLFIGAINLIIGFTSLTFIGGIRKLFASLLKSSITTIRNMWTKIVDFFKNFGTNSSNIVKNMATAVVNFFRNLFTQATNIFTRLRTFGASIWNAIREAILGVVRGIWQGVVQRFNNLLSSVRNIMHNVRSTIVNLWNRVMSFFRGINLHSVGRDIIRGLINGIGSMASAVWEKAKSIATGIGDSIKRALQISSPSKLTFRFGEWTTEGLSNGIISKIKDVRKATDELMGAMIPEATDMQTKLASPMYLEIENAKYKANMIELLLKFEGGLA